MRHCLQAALLSLCAGSYIGAVACSDSSGSLVRPASSALPAPIVPASSPYAVSQSVPISTASPIAGQAAVPISFVLPSGGNVQATVALPLIGTIIPPNTSLIETVNNRLPSGLPALAVQRRVLGADRNALTAGDATLIQVDQLVFSNQVTLATQPTFAFVVPSALAELANVSYWIANFNPLVPSVGWNLAYAGPGAVKATTISFAGLPNATTFQANIPQYFALYAVSAAATKPTPAPRVSAEPAPPAITASPSSVSLLAPGVTITVSITDASTTFKGTYSAVSANTAIATASLSGTTLTITAVAPGQTTVIVSSSDGRQAIIGVGVTATSVPVQ